MLELEIKSYVVIFFSGLHHPTSLHSEFPIPLLTVSSRHKCNSVPKEICGEEGGSSVWERFSLGLLSPLCHNWTPQLNSPFLQKLVLIQPQNSFSSWKLGVLFTSHKRQSNTKKIVLAYLRSIWWIVQLKNMEKLCPETRHITMIPIIIMNVL